MEKILFITPCGMPFPPKKGGAVGTLIDYLVQKNEEKKEFDFTIVTIKDKDIDIPQYENTKCHTFKKNKMIKKFDDILNYVFRKLLHKNIDGNYLWKLIVIYKYKRFLKKNKFDKYIIENSGFLLKVFPKKGIIPGKVYFHLHNDIPNNIDIKRFERCYGLLISQFLIKKIRTLSNSSDYKYSILKNCIDVNRFSKDYNEIERNEFRKNLDVFPDEKIIIFVGRIVEYKGIKLLINAFLKLNNPKLRLLIVGTSNFGISSSTLFEQEINKICLENKRIIKTGFVNNENLWKYYSYSDIAVLPSLWAEPAGLTIIEAMMSGIPVITTNVGGIPEYVGSKCIVLDVDDKIEETITTSISKVLNSYDEYKSNALTVASDIKKEYNLENYYRNFSDLIKSQNNIN